MAITTRIAPGYLRTQLLWAILCLGFGLWGAWDYWVAIPKKELVYREFTALSTAQGAFDQKADAATLQKSYDLLSDELDLILSEAARSEGLEVGGSRDLDWFTQLLVLASDSSGKARALVEGQDSEAARDLLRLSDAISNSRSANWFNNAAIVRAAVMSRQPNTAPNAGELKAYDLITNRLNELGSPKAVQSYDRAIQWAFILCLPFTPWFLWSLWSVRRQSYTLEDDGSVVVNGDRWAAADITEIDMSRWMSKSMATLRHRDGRVATLDDFKLKHTDQIVGAVASRLHPDQWTVEAKPVKPAAEADAASDITDDATKIVDDPPIDEDATKIDDRRA